MTDHITVKDVVSVFENYAGNIPDDAVYARIYLLLSPLFDRAKILKRDDPYIVIDDKTIKSLIAVMDNAVPDYYNLILSAIDYHNTYVYLQRYKVDMLRLSTKALTHMKVDHDKYVENNVNKVSNVKDMLNKLDEVEEYLSQRLQLLKDRVLDTIQHLKHYHRQDRVLLD